MRYLPPTIRTGLLAAASLLFFRGPLPAGVLINEAGYYMDHSGDTGKEWIELYNPDTTARDLSGYDLYPGRTPHYIIPAGFALLPHSFAVVHLRATGQNTGTDLYEGTAPTSNMPNTKASMALFTGAAHDTIVDFMQYGGSGQTYEATAADAGIWTRGAYIDTVRCGHSLGLRLNGVDSNRVADWSDCARPTPGYSNNPPPYDVAVAGLSTEPAAVPARLGFTLNADIANRGASMARHTAVMVFSDDDRDSMPESGERMYFQTAIDSIGAVCSLGCPMPGLEEGAYALAVTASCSSDAYAWNNYQSITVTAGSPLAINEIMYGPAAGQPEWIELYNRSPMALDLHGWTIEDLAALPSIIDTAHTLIPPQQFVIVTQTAGLPWAPCPVLKPVRGLPSLNNDNELVCLRDSRGVAVDQVRYSDAWGGGGGISLERINPFLSPGDPASWGGCVAASRATPGAQNSVFIERPAAGASLEVSPNPFSPDNDGYEDHLIISLKLGWTRATVTLKIFDRQGRLARTLAAGRDVPGNADLVWDGLNDRGTVCPMGLYVVSLEAKDANGSGAIKKAKTVAIARKL